MPACEKDNLIDGRVSVIVPAFNASQTLRSCLESLLKQSYQNIEIIVVDNVSNDCTLELAGEILAGSHRKHIILTESRRGVAYARNRGIEAASGQYICFLDSDDYLYDDAIEKRVSFLTNTNSLLVFASYDRVKEGKVISTVKPPPRVDNSNKFFKNYIPNLSGMYDASQIGKVLQVDIGHEDYDMWLSILNKCEYGLCIPGGSIGAYRVTSESLSANKLRAALWHYLVLRRHERSQLKCLAFFIQYAMAGSLTALRSVMGKIS